MTGRERPKLAGKTSLTWRFTVERVTGIEPALSAWEAVPSGPLCGPDLREGLSASDRERPLVTGVNGPLMARRSLASAAPIPCPAPPSVLLESCQPSGRGRGQAREEQPRSGLASTQRARP
jgi:hypothetical protein